MGDGQVARPSGFAEVIGQAHEISVPPVAFDELACWRAPDGGTHGSRTSAGLSPVRRSSWRSSTTTSIRQARCFLDAHVAALRAHRARCERRAAQDEGVFEVNRR